MLQERHSTRFTQQARWLCPWLHLSSPLSGGPVAQSCPPRKAQGFQSSLRGISNVTAGAGGATTRQRGPKHTLYKWEKPSPREAGKVCNVTSNNNTQ